MRSLVRNSLGHSLRICALRYSTATARSASFTPGASFFTPGARSPMSESTSSTLHPRDLSRGRVLHEVVERDAAVAPDPGRRVGQGRRHVLLHSCLSDLSGDGGVQQISSGNAHFLPAHMVLASHQETIREDGNRKTHLVGTKHVLIEHRARNRLDERVGNPGPVVTCEHLPQFIRTDFVHRHFVRLGVVLDRDLR
ncbi:unnamed protein product [Mycena citricolor]|uniref:Uncharacterized protein n=1 Tax=Mycena citricolor TaxID=2018698 RepID=A0AAD2GXK7_9AGAR|nr:unnamed protein product [Mycena citricolor]